MQSCKNLIKKVKFSALIHDDFFSTATKPLSQPITVRQRPNVEELCHGPPAYLWNYLRRSKAVIILYNFLYNYS